MATPSAQYAPLDNSEQAVGLFLKVSHCRADDILQSGGEFDYEKKSELQTLYDNLKSNIGRIKAEHFSYAAAEPNKTLGVHPSRYADIHIKCIPPAIHPISAKTITSLA